MAAILTGYLLTELCEFIDRLSLCFVECSHFVRLQVDSGSTACLFVSYSIAQCYLSQLVLVNLEAGDLRTSPFSGA